MELTTKQIQYIENRLKNEEVKYWDIRIEMLDHIVTDVEHQLQKGEKFNTAVQNSFVALGWKENFNGSGFEGIIHQRNKDYGKLSRKNYRSFCKTIFSKPKMLLFVTMMFSSCYLLSFFDKFILYVIGLYLIIMGVGVLFFLTKHRVFRSIQMNHALIKATFSLSILNMFIYLPKMFEVDILKYPVLISMIASIIIIHSVVGGLFFLQEYKKINTIYKKLIS